MRQSEEVEFELTTGNGEEAAPPVPIRIDGVRYLLRKPKLSLAVGLVTLMEGGDMRPGVTVADVGSRLVDLLWQFVAYIEPEPAEPMVLPNPDGKDGYVENPNAGQARGQAKIIERLRDPRDTFDILDLAPLFERVSRGMFDRPTGPSPASSAKQGDGGTDSAAASPEQPAGTSGT
jgi:hypothetical protein